MLLYSIRDDYLSVYILQRAEVTVSNVSQCQAFCIQAPKLSRRCDDNQSCSPRRAHGTRGSTSNPGCIPCKPCTGGTPIAPQMYASVEGWRTPEVQRSKEPCADISIL